LVLDDHHITGAVDACPVAVTHTNLPYAEELHEAVRRFLDGDELPPCPWWRTAVGPALRHFAAPPS
jgi:glucose-6-phosphate dehydrogenase assembly protein OpcA